MPHRDALLPPKTRRVLHLDVDAFLASVESSLDSSLRGKPLVIGADPNTRGLVMSCSYEARAFGVHPGMFAREAKRRCPSAIFRPGDSRAANGVRARLASLLLRFSPVVEIASIDDFFLDLTGTTRLAGAACQVAENIQRTVWEELALPVTLGLGTNKLMARMAGKLGKPRGVAEILPGHEEAFLTHLPVQHLPGVGHAIRSYLEDFAIRTAGDLRQVSREVLFASFGVHGLHLHERVRGIDNDAVQANCHFDAAGNLQSRAPKSIHRDSSFEPEEGRWEQIEAMLAYLVDRAADRLRSHDLQASSMEVRILYVDTRAPKQQAKQQGGSWESQKTRLRRKLTETHQPDRAPLATRAQPAARVAPQAGPGQTGRGQPPDPSPHPRRPAQPVPRSQPRRNPRPSPRKPQAAHARTATTPSTKPSITCAPATALAVWCAARPCRWCKTTNWARTASACAPPP